MADIAHILHFPLSEMHGLALDELAMWWAEAERVAKPPERSDV